MSMFRNCQSVSVTGGKFAITTKVKKGKDPWRKHIAPGAFHNSSERLDYNPPNCHPDTRVAVIRDIIDWIQDSQKTTFILWLNGPAGAGKTAIAQMIAELCCKLGCLAASFFWSRYAAARNTEERLIATLAYQLLTAIPKLRHPVEEAVATDPYIFTRSLAAQMDSLVIQPLKAVFEDGGVVSEIPKVVILDGLDECATHEAQQSILKVIADSVRKFPIPLCFLIASRPEKAIRDSFNDQPLHAITARLVLDEKYHPGEDIRLFLVESFKIVKRTHELRSLLPHDWPTNNAIDRLVRKSSGQFIYPATVVKFVGSSRGRPEERLEIILGITDAGGATPFAELDALYCQIFSFVLKEHLPRVLEILSVVLMGRGRLTARQIETILHYRRGELQLVLIDMHSVLHVPVIEAEEEGDDDDGDEDKDKTIYVLHASLEDFLKDRTRSKDFYIDKANARVAQHLLRYIREYSPDSKVGYSLCDIIVFYCFRLFCRKAFVTRELLIDCFSFDPERYAFLLPSVQEMDWEGACLAYIIVIDLCVWFQAQEAKVQEYFCPASLHAHLSRSWEAAIDFTCGNWCHYLREMYPSDWARTAAAITHPEILCLCPYLSDVFQEAIGVQLDFAFNQFSNEGSIMVEIQSYLRDQERAGRYFVDGGMYATLSLRMVKIILASETCLGDKVSDGSESEDRIPVPDNEVLDFAIITLPFYLSRADYKQELAVHARSLLKSEELYEAINLYLKGFIEYNTQSSEHNNWEL